MAQREELITLEDLRLFEHYLVLLDLGLIRRDQWDKMQAIAIKATFETGNIEKGALGYENTVQIWRTSIHYDGKD